MELGLDQLFLIQDYLFQTVQAVRQVVVDVLLKVVPVEDVSAFLSPFEFQSVQQAVDVAVVFADFCVILF